MKSRDLYTHLETIEEINRTLEVLEGGGIILFPTDTIWGLGCDAFNEEAVSAVRQIKRVDTEEPMVLIVDSLEMLRRYVRTIHPRMETLLAYHQRPLTVIYEDPMHVPDFLPAADRTLAIRVVKDPFCQALVRKFGRPLVAAAPHRKGEDPPSRYGEISSELLTRVDYTVRYRQEERESCELSVMVRFDESGELIFVRE